MYKYILVLAAALFAFASTQAHAARRHGNINCIPMTDSMRPDVIKCNPNFLAGVRSIKVTMKRVSAYTPEQPRRIRQHRRHGAPQTTIQVAKQEHKEKVHASASASTSPAKAVDGVVRASTGAVAYVAKHATAAFQCVVTALEGAGYKIKEMGGFARSGHIRGSLHYSGRALDINQLSRNVTSPKMPANEIELAKGCGLISGAQWRYADSGHFQLGGWDGQRMRRTQVAAHHSHHSRYRRYARHYHHYQKVASR